MDYLAFGLLAIAPTIRLIFLATGITLFAIMWVPSLYRLASRLWRGRRRDTVHRHGVMYKVFDQAMPSCPRCMALYLQAQTTVMLYDPPMRPQWMETSQPPSVPTPGRAKRL